MNKNYGLFFLAPTFFFSFISSAQRMAPVRKKIDFDEGWKFHFGHAADPAKDFNYGLTTIFSKTGNAPGTAIDPRFKDTDWRSLDLPHDWAVELPFANVKNDDLMSHGYKSVGGLFPETSIGWYRKHFAIARSDFRASFPGPVRWCFQECKFLAQWILFREQSKWLYREIV
jgi:beta-galactosidase